MKIVTGLIVAALGGSVLGAVSAQAGVFSDVIKANGAPVADDLASGATTPGKKCGEGDEKPCLTVRRAVEHALLLCSGPPICPDEKPDGEAKYRRAKIAEKVEADVTDAPLAPDEVVIVEGLVGKMYSPVVVRAVWDALGPPSSVKK
jgi:hypothetical protein